jgi:SAM-dependent methyltransferase
MPHEPCPACQNENGHRTILATDIFFGSLEDFTYHQCLRCGHVHLKQDDRVGIGEFGRGSFEDRDEQVVVGVLDHPALGWGFYGPRSRWIGERTGLGPGQTVLDVGAGSGHFLSLLRRHYGCECTGLDLDPAFAARASKDCIRRVTGDFADFETGERFDLITMFHLIEHLDDPNAAVAKAYHLLKPGGYLYVETPAADSLGFTLFGKFWLPLLPPYHRHVFSRQSLSRLVNEHFGCGCPAQPIGTYVPGEIIVSTWMWFARYSPHPFRRKHVPAGLKYAALIGMTTTSLLALPIELAVGASARMLDVLTHQSILLAGHQRLLVRKAV